MLPLQFSYTLLTVLAVDLLATAGDVTLSWTSPIYPKLYSNNTNLNPLGRPITEDEDALLGSLLTIGAMLGPFPFGYVAEKFGRKPAVLSIAIPHVISYTTMAFSRHIYLYYFGRILGGLAMGGGYTVLPMYIAEVSRDANRGTMSQTLNIFWAVGNFLPYAVGPFISILYFNVMLAFIPLTFLVLFSIIGPETPYYLVKVNKIQKAKESLMLLRSRDEKAILEELNRIQSCLNQERKGNFIEVFKKRELRKALIICMVLIVAQEISGFCAITFYLQPIFEVAGTGLPSDISALVVGAAMLVSSFFAPCLIEKSGRKKLTTYSCFGMFISLTMLGAFFYIQNSSSGLNTAPIFWLPIFSLILYIFSYNFGISSVPWTLCSELFPSNFKQFSSTSVASVCWMTSFLVTKYFNQMNAAMGMAGTFWLFAGTCFVSGIFSVLWVPETKGKSFSEIQEMLRGERVEVSQLFQLLTVDLLATSGDVTLSWTSPVFPKLHSNDTTANPLGEAITDDEDAWIGSLVTIGAMIGPLPAGFVSEKFGRKIGLLSLAIPHIISLFSMAFAHHVVLFYVGRFLGGLSTGAGYTLLPMYIAEISDDSHRGTFSQTLNVFWAFGNFIPYAIGPYLSIQWFNIVLAIIPTTFFIVFLILGPETPYYLVSRNQLKKAETSLMKLRSLDERGVKDELDHIKNNLKQEENGHFTDILLNPGLRKAMMICVVLVISQELSGFCAITFYLQTIFEAAGTEIASDVSALIVGFSIFLSSFFTPFPHRQVIALSTLGTFFYMQDSTDISTDPVFWIPIFSLILYIFAFHFGICSIPWTLSSELFPSNVKGVAAPTITILCWLSSFLVTKFFNDMNRAMGKSGSFWFFAGCTLCTGVFSIFFVPETQGKSFAEIQEMLNKGSRKTKPVTDEEAG
ncbi:hypothetical protein NQ315_011924 [Exocentrus adspersus]|uniref:Major facilitator superfamily (MFS) profile domain-containing protein n=1 Tax=Exocentrus adspersus TaxID=1586481 RepID=A0AAV8W0U5_9CUCU|nr:hypothetical protein NQ315_011924 [Exocentrus adspersus]